MNITQISEYRVSIPDINFFLLPAMVDFDCIRHSYFYIHVIYIVDVDY